MPMVQSARWTFSRVFRRRTTSPFAMRRPSCPARRPQHIDGCDRRATYRSVRWPRLAQPRAFRAALGVWLRTTTCETPERTHAHVSGGPVVRSLLPRRTRIS